MNRSNLLVCCLLFAVLALSLGGCANDKKDDMASAEAAERRYKLLNGSTSDSAPDGKPMPEPDVNADTRFAAGQLAESTRKLDAAVVQYQQALIVDRNHLPALYRLGVCLTRMREYDRAYGVWRQYIKATGDGAAGYSNLGFCHELAGDVAGAERAYQEGIRRDPKSQPCRVNYGLMLARQRRADEAGRQLAAVLKPDEVAYNLAAIYAEQGEVDLARTELKRALAANPHNAAAQEKLAALPQE